MYFQLKLFAIKNPQPSASREIVGMHFSADNLLRC